MTPGTVIAGRFWVEGLVRSGGMGSIYQARDQLTGRDVAIKIARATGDICARFVREAAALSELAHPCIVRYVAHGAMPSGELYLAMEWLSGEDLSDRLARGPLGVDETIALGVRMARAFGVFHARGLVHRDVKPSNIYLPDRDPEKAKLVDFGLVRWTRAMGDQQTQVGRVVGTPGYMSPEQASGSRTVNAATDVFALGCVLFECLTGRALFVGVDVVALQIKIMLEEAPLVGAFATVPRSLERLVARMLAKNVDTRPPDGASVEKLLLELAEPAETSLGSGARGGPSSGGAPRGITSSEQRVYCVILSRLLNRGVAPEDATVSLEALGGPIEVLRDAARQYGGVLEVMASGRIVVALEGIGTAAEQAARAARCAITIRAVTPQIAVVLATGRGEGTSGRVPVGEVIDRAAKLLSIARGVHGTLAPGAPPVFVDELTARLLEGRFDVSPPETIDDVQACQLRGVRATAVAGRTLLGKATPYVGRARELGVIEALFDECASDGVAHSVLLEGAEGLGKSRMVHEVLQRLGTRADVWMARGDPMSAGAPFGMLAQAIRHGLFVFEGETALVQRAKLKSRLAAFFSDGTLDRVTVFIAELLRVERAASSDAESPLLRAALQDPVLMGDQMRRAFFDLIGAACRIAPVVFVLEDLQWGDLPSVEALDAVLRDTPDLPFLVFATARPEVRQLFPSLWEARSFTRVRLGDLGKKPAAELVRSALGAAATDDVVERIVDRAAGNPFFLEELVRAFAEKRGTVDTLPETVLATVEARLEELPPEARRVLRAGSVLGQVFWPSAVASLLGENDLSRVEPWLTHACEREVIVRRLESSFPSEREYAFRNVLVQQAAYARLLDDDRTLGHRLAAEWLEGVGGKDAVVLAEHFERGHAPDRALGWYLRGAEQALAGNEYAAALARAERGVACKASGVTLGALHLVMSEAYRWMADHASAGRLAEQAMKELDHGSEPWLAAAGNLCIASSLRGEVARLVALSRELADLDDTDSRMLADLQIVAWARATAWLMRHGETALADTLLGRIERTLAQQPSGVAAPSVMARVHYARAGRALHEGRLDENLTLSEAAAASFEEAGMLRNLCVQRKSLALANLRLGRNVEAQQALELALSEGDRLGLSDNAADVRDLLGVALARLGRTDEALTLVAEALRDAVQRGGKWVEGRARTTLARVLFLRGDHDRGEAESRAALACIPDKHPLRAIALATHGRFELARGNIDAALDTTREAMDLLKRGEGADDEIAIRLARIEALAAANDDDVSRAARAAREALHARAAKIRDPLLRASFLEGIPEHVLLEARTR
jgi:tetratricopeptide (TPR) repeat protein